MSVVPLEDAPEICTPLPGIAGCNHGDTRHRTTSLMRSATTTGPMNGGDERAWEHKPSLQRSGRVTRESCGVILRGLCSTICGNGSHAVRGVTMTCVERCRLPLSSSPLRHVITQYDLVLAVALGLIKGSIGSPYE